MVIKVYNDYLATLPTSAWHSMLLGQGRLTGSANKRTGRTKKAESLL